MGGRRLVWCGREDVSVVWERDVSVVWEGRRLVCVVWEGEG